MGDIFGNSFKRELGKNTAKVVSNALFGDSWSTPYRRINTSRGPSASAQMNFEAAQLRHQAKMAAIQAREQAKEAELELRRQIEQEKQEARMAEIRARQEAEEQARLLAIDTAVLENVDKIVAIQIPRTEDEIDHVLESLTPNMHNAQWKRGAEGEIRNQYSMALLTKYTSLVDALHSVNPQSAKYRRYYDVVKRANVRMVTGAVPESITLSSDMELLAVQLDSIVSTLNTHGWSFRKKSPESVLADAYYKLFLDGLSTLVSYDSNSEQLEHLYAAKRKLARSRFLHKHIIATLFLGSAYAELIIVVLLFMLLAKGSITGYLIALIILCVIPFCPVIINAIRKIVRANNRKAKAAQERQPVLIEQTEVKPTTIAEPIEEPVAEDVVPKDDIFFDLNEGECIDTRLHDIWQRYAKKVAPEIIARKPIFAADGVKDSILFVGINPSSSPDDDKLFLHSDSDNSLLYGSFYQREDAPIYFKALEGFASQCGFAYTQMNLLYAPENNRDLLLRANSDFIREQLELSYDTIVKINPVAIVFFTDYCKRLIFGADRWVNPVTEKNGAFILNGTKIPVFFSEDVTTLNAMQQQELIQQIKSAL